MLNVGRYRYIFSSSRYNDVVSCLNIHVDNFIFSSIQGCRETLTNVETSTGVKSISLTLMRRQNRTSRTVI